jgi:hypothetical protein
MNAKFNKDGELLVERKNRWVPQFCRFSSNVDMTCNDRCPLLYEFTPPSLYHHPIEELENADPNDHDSPDNRVMLGCCGTRYGPIYSLVEDERNKTVNEICCACGREIKHGEVMYVDLGLEEGIAGKITTYCEVCAVTMGMIENEKGIIK